MLFWRKTAPPDTPVIGVEAANCVVCHANNQALLQRQPTAFHADVPNCTACHIEHGGPAHRPTRMDHAELATFSLRQLDREGRADPAKAAAAEGLESWMAHASSSASGFQSAPSPQEAVLNCAACHANQDPHRQFFGNDCTPCHTTTAWTIAQFRHPSPRSTDCVQCHQAPPSHYMMHFKMVSAAVARQEHARVEQCHLCHQTHSWNDIKGIGWYKHH